MPWRDTFTITQQEDGSWKAKMHGYPFWFKGETAGQCLAAAGEYIDRCILLRSETLFQDTQ